MKMKMKLRRTHIPEKILQQRNKRVSEDLLLKEVYEILQRDNAREEHIISTLQENLENYSNDFDIEKLEAPRIFHIQDIEKICIEYRLRFLTSPLYKAPLPYEAILRIKQLEKQHNISLKGFKILGPAKVFKLENADDPLLFAPINQEYFYLIHSWGRDLHPFRKVLMWPFRHLENFMFFLFMLSLLLTCLVPVGMFGYEQKTSEFFILLFFMFKWVTALAIFYGFSLGKNFSSAVWRSKFYNA